MAIKRIKINYVSALPEQPPFERINVPNSHKEALGRSIKQKVRQNESGRAAGAEYVGRYMVR